jgi:glycosyltransferase involved in cell wall biosynthesis
MSGIVRSSWSEENMSCEKMKIAIVAASLRYVGGQAVQADLLLRKWQGDPEVEARLVPIDPVFPKGLRWIERIPVLRTMVREPIYLRELWRGLEDANVVHIFSASYWSFLIAPAPAWWVTRLRGRKALIHYHSGEARDHLRRSRSARSVLGKVDAVVVPSQYLVDVFAEFEVEAEVVANIVDLTQFSFRRRCPLRPHLICTRGFSPYYCVDIVVRAFAEVQKSFPDARLDLVGGGPLEAEIRALVAKLKLSGVNFTGVVSQADIAKYYGAADIFINASRLDNMPVSVMEAFASGTPVVTTSPECMPYLVEHGKTGLLSPVGDPASLAANVVRLLREPELAANLARNGREESCRYGWSSVRQEWIDVYRRLLGRGATNSGHVQNGGSPQAQHNPQSELSARR